jgi:hypothetical protein
MKFLNKLLITFEEHLYDVPKQFIVANKEDLLDFLESKGYDLLLIEDEYFKIHKNGIVEKGKIEKIKHLS